MRIDASGNVGIGDSSPTGNYGKNLQIHTAATSGSSLQLTDGTTGSGVNDGLQIICTNGLSYIWNREATDMVFATSNLERMRISSDGKIGIGQVPATDWSASYDALQVGAQGVMFAHTSGGGDASTWITNNAYVSTGGWKALSTNEASHYQQKNGEHYWSNAPSVSAGAGLGFTNRMKLDSSGNLSLMTDGADIKLYYTEPRTFITNSGASVTIKQMDNNANAAYIDFASWTNSSLMRIMNSGVVKVGKTTTALSDAGHQFGPDGYVYHTRTGNIMWLNTLSSGSAITFAATGVTKGNIVIASGGTTYNTTSDRRLKDNIQPIADATDKLMAMKPVTHTWIADPEADAVHGFIAQEMQEIVPEAISGDADSEEMMSMDYGRITPVLVAALQEATNEIKALKQRVSELEEL